MAPRPIWKGQIRLSLVSIPVEIYSATQSGRSISFRQIHRKSGKRVHYERVVEGIGPVDRNDIVKGYEVGDDEYVLLTDEEIDEVKLETRKTLELVQFVDSSEISPLYFDKPYYVVPQDELAEDAFRVVRDALRQSKRTGLGQLAMRGKEHLVALRPCGSGLLLETLHYESEVRKSDPIFAEIGEKKTDDDLLGVATELITRKTAPFDAAAFKDRYVDALKSLIADKRKSKGKTKVEREETRPSGSNASNVVDLMASLKKSLERDQTTASDAKSSTARKTTSGKATSAKAASGKTAAGKSASGKAAADKGGAAAGKASADSSAARSTRSGTSRRKSA